MEQRNLNIDLFAALTFQSALLEQIAARMFVLMPDKGEAFMAEFIDGMRYHLTVAPGSDPSDEDFAQQLQTTALLRAERFFESVRNRL